MARRGRAYAQTSPTSSSAEPSFRRPAGLADEWIVSNAITRRIAEKRRKESSDDAVGDACLLWAKEQRAIRRPATFVATLVQQRRRARTTPSIVDAVVAHANRLVEERGLQPLPLGITPHKLRHTFASILVAIGRDPTYVMQQLGHTDPAFTLRVYAHAMRRSEEERERLKALVEGHDWAHIGHKTAQSPSAATKRTGR